MPHLKLAHHAAEVGRLAGLFASMEERAKVLHEEQLAHFGIEFGKLPLSGLYAAEQVVGGTKELLHGCLNNYGNSHVPDDAPTWLEDGLHQERVRLTYLLLNAMFVQFISALEYCMTHALPAVTDVHPPPRGRAKVYLAAVFQRSAELGWISQAEATAWVGINEYRNALVHRNGISDKDAQYPITDTWGLQFAAGHAITAGLDLVPDLAMWSLESYGRWTTAFLRHLQPKGWASLIPA